jgi:hypothetical protein
MDITSKMLSGIWRLKSPLQNSLHTTQIMNPCRGEFIRLGINGIRGYFDICYLASEVALQSPARPKKCPTHPTKSPAYDEKINHKNKKTERKFGFLLTLLMRLNYLLTDEINHQVN